MQNGEELAAYGRRTCLIPAKRFARGTGGRVVDAVCGVGSNDGSSLKPLRPSIWDRRPRAGRGEGRGVGRGGGIRGGLIRATRVSARRAADCHLM